MGFSSVSPHDVLMERSDKNVRKKMAYQADGKRISAEYQTTVTRRTYFIRGPADSDVIADHRDISSAGTEVHREPWSKSITNEFSEIVTEFMINYKEDGTAEGRSITTQLDDDGWTLYRRFKPEPLPEEYM